MFRSLLSRVASTLDQPGPETTAQYLARLMAENNALLRELVEAVTGQPAKAGTVRPAPSVGQRIRTDKDVLRVTRESVIDGQQQKHAEQAPWRIPGSGPGSPSKSPSTGSGTAGVVTPSAPPSGT